MKVDTEAPSQPSIRTGEVELLEFLSQRRAWEYRDREVSCSEVRALVRGIGNGQADGDAAVAGAHLVVGKVNRLPRPAATITSRRQFVDKLLTNNYLSRICME
jgi:hypothetical protein